MERAGRSASEENHVEADGVIEMMSTRRMGMRLRVITQVARTLIGVSGVERVELRVDGKPWDLWTMDGRILRTETDYDRLAGWTRVCGDRSVEERELGLSRCFSALP